ncbi:MAG TPA: hypothetical protein VHO69_10905 [Phototrophicaceae bacterium]|nr:hypothetical protein [Phototrophicaceae bacterium]
MFDAGRLKQLTQTVLKNREPSARMEALLEIRHYDDPRVTDLLRRVSENDKDPEVRDLAKNLYIRRQLAGEGEFSSPAVEPDPASAPDWLTQSQAADTWTCLSCGGVNAGGRACRFCGGERPVPAQSKPLVGEDDLVLSPQLETVRTVQAKTVMRGVTACGILFMLPFLLVGVIAGFLAYNASSLGDGLGALGVTITGRVTAKEVSRDDVSYYVAYRFQYEGRSYTGRQPVEPSFYNQVETGAAVSILILPGDPNTSRLVGSNRGATVAFAPLAVFAVVWNIVVCSVVIIMLLTGLGFRRVLRRAR